MALLDSVLWILSCSLILTPSVAQPSPQQCHILTISSSLTLQQAVEQSASTTSSSCVRIELPSGEHEISSQALFSAGELRDVEFVGLGDSVFVSCSYALSENFTWNFDRLDSVKMYSLHFEGCPRPMRLNTIAEVEIQDCSFRHVHTVIHHCSIYSYIYINAVYIATYTSLQYIYIATYTSMQYI